MSRLPRWSVILIAFAISLSLWAFLFVRANPTNSQVKSSTLVVRNLPNNLVVVDENSRRETTLPIIEAQIFAAQSAFSQIPAQGLTYYVDATGKGAGEHEFAVQVDWLPEWGYYRAEIRPEQQLITLRFEEVISKVFVPEIEATGMSSDAVYTRSAQLDDPTKEVTVSGPQTLVNQVDGVRLRVAYRTAQMGSTESISAVPVNSQGEQVFGVDITPSQVDVVVSVQPKFGIRSVVIKPNLVGVVAPGYEITGIASDPPTVAIQGDVQTISDTVSIDTDVIDVDGLRETITQTVQLKLNNVALVNQLNTLAQVRIEIVPIERSTRMRFLVPIEIRDVPEGYVFSVEPSVYVIDVLVSPEAFRRNTIGLIQAFVSVGAWESSQPSRQVQVELPANIQRESELITVDLRQIVPPLTVTPTDPAPDETTIVDENENDVSGGDTVTPTILPVLTVTSTVQQTVLPTLTPTASPTLTPTPGVGDS